MVYFSSGDAPFFFTEQLASLSWFPHIWNNAKDFGENLLPRLWIDYPFRLIVKLLYTLGFEWGVIDKLMWLIAIGIGIISMYSLARFIVGKAAAFFAVIIYLTNTYALFLFGGGQLGVALAYGLAPYILLRFIQYKDKGIHNGVWLSLLLMFDLRIGYLVIGAILLYQFISKTFRFRSFLVSLLVAGLVHAFWILPTFMTGVGAETMGADFTNSGMLRFLSFADFSHTLSLLHPNWPENLFGKVYFLQPEFLLLPLIAYIAVVSSSKRKVLVFFAFLSLLGAFLAKGVQAPLGEFFGWCFTYIPGFVMFRDPTKFYVFIALGYAILIPSTLIEVGKRLKSIKWIIYGVFILYWCFTIRPLFLGQLSGNFKPKSIPNEYVKLKDMLMTDPIPSRVLWIPAKEQFSYASDIHPALSSNTLFHNASLSGIMTIATSSSFISSINEAGIRFVVVPKDIEHTLFLSNYHYDPALRENMIYALLNTSLTPVIGYSDIAVFENKEFSSMIETKPNTILRQQSLSHTGLVISIISLLIFLGIMLCRYY